MRKLALVLLPLALLACKRMSATAKEEFGKKYSCPDDRVAVKDRTDLDPTSLFVSPSNEEPPEEVKKDPARLAKWKTDRDEKRRQLEAGYRRSFTVYEVSGCDHDVLMACTNANLAGQDGATTVVCQEKPLPPR